MNLGSCHSPAWVPSKTPPNSAWAAARRIRGQLCRLCDLALEAKDCGKLSRFRHHEFKILRTMHGDFERLNLNTVHGIPAAECDVCCLARATKRLVLSAYAGEWTDFIRATHGTRDGMVARVNRDFGDDFRRYIAQAGLLEHSKAHQLMARAELVSQYLAAAGKVIEIPPGAEEEPAKYATMEAPPAPEREYLIRSADRMESLHIRIMTLGGSPLRILR